SATMFIVMLRVSFALDDRGGVIMGKSVRYLCPGAVRRQRAHRGSANNGTCVHVATDRTIERSSQHNVRGSYVQVSCVRTPWVANGALIFSPNYRVRVLVQLLAVSSRPVVRSTSAASATMFTVMLRVSFAL